MAIDIFWLINSLCLEKKSHEKRRRRNEKAEATSDSTGVKLTLVESPYR